MTLTLPPTVAVILHYESCSYRRWREKFTQYARRRRDEGRDAIMQAATFSVFYHRSIDCCARLLDNHVGPQSAIAEAEAAARALWSEFKLEPPAVSASRPILHARTLGRLTLIPPPAAAVVVDGSVEKLERALHTAFDS